jgi:hypothetical protein
MDKIDAINDNGISSVSIDNKIVNNNLIDKVKKSINTSGKGKVLNASGIGKILNASGISKITFIIRTIAVATVTYYIVGSYSFWCHRYQEFANLHDDTTQLEEMQTLVIIFGSISFVLFATKRKFWGIIFAILTMWAIYFLFVPFSCRICGAG